MRQKDQLYRFALRIVGNRTLAEDILQEVLIKCWKLRESLPGYRNPEGWMLRVTKNLAIDTLRSKKNRAEPLEHAGSMMSKAMDPARHTELSDLVQIVRQMMEALPEKQKMIFHLREVEGLSYKEIGEALDISVQDVKVNLHRARKKIKMKLVTVQSYGT